MRVGSHVGPEHLAMVHSETVQESTARGQNRPQEGEGLKIEYTDLPRYKLEAENLHNAAETINQALKISNYHLQFNLHEKSGRYQVKVVDTNSNEVIREIPPERMLEIAADIRQMMDKLLGLVVDELV